MTTSKQLVSQRHGPWIEIILEDELIKTNGKGYDDVESAAENCESKGRMGGAEPSPAAPSAPKVTLPPASNHAPTPEPTPEPSPEPTSTSNKFHEFMKKYWMMFVIGSIILFVIVIIGVIVLSVTNRTPVPPPAPLQMQPMQPMQPIQPMQPMPQQ